jgi:hypothetical protein
MDGNRKLEGKIEVLKLKRVRDGFGADISQHKIRNAKKVKLNRKQKINTALKKQLLKNYGLFVES